MPRLLVATALTAALSALAAPAAADFTQTGTLGSGKGFAAGQLDGPWRADVGPDGSVYVVDRNNVRIVKYGPGGAFERMWGRNVTSNGSFGVCTAACAKGRTGRRRVS